MVTCFNNGALHVNLDEAGRGDLVEEETVRVDQEELLVLVEAGGDVAADALAPAVKVEQPVDGGHLAAQQLLALGVGHALDATDVVDREDAVLGAGAHAATARSADDVRDLLHEAAAAAAAVPHLHLDDALQLLAEQPRVHDRLHALPTLHFLHVLRQPKITRLEN